MATTVILIEALGWAGATLILLAYIMVSRGKWDGRSMVFQITNLFGAIFFVVNLLYYRAYPSATLNVIWAGIAIANIVSIRRKPLPPPRTPDQ